MKKYITAIILIVLTFLLGIGEVKAATNNFELVDFKVQSKKSTVEVDDISLSGNTVTSDVTFNKLNDYVAFELTIKNTDDDEYKVISVEDNNTNSNIDITYMFGDNYIKKGETTKVTVKLKYVQELTDQEKLSLNNLKISINFMKSDGSTEILSVNPTPDSTSNSIINPTTGISILKYIILAILSAAGLIIIITKKNKKIGTALLILAAVAIPFSVMANEKYGINLKFENIEVIGKDTTNNYATLIEGSNINSKISSVEGNFRKATTAEYNAVKDSLTDDNIISTEDSPKPAYVWQTAEGLLYYSEAKTIYMNEDSSDMFLASGFTSIDLTGMDSSKVTTMKNMFADSNITELNLSSFDTSNVTDMSFMFSNCNNLEELDISSFDTSNVTDMQSMFRESYNLRTIYVFDEWNTSKVTESASMFDSNNNLVGEQVTVREWETYDYNENYDDFDYAHVDEGFSNPGYLTLKGHDPDFSILLENENLGVKVANIGEDAYYFRKATQEEYNEAKDSLTEDNIISTSFSPMITYMWRSGDSAVYYSPASTIYTNRDASYMFEYSLFESIDISGMNGSKTKSMYGFFSYTSMKEIIFGDFDTSNVTDMGSMFNYSSNLEELDISSLNTSNVTNMGYMFSDCEKLTTIYVSDKWDTSNLENPDDYIFYGNYNLVGEKATAFKYDNDSSYYAHVDEGPSNPGYFTLKGHTKDFVVLIKGYEFKEKLTEMDTTNKDFRKATLEEYNVAKETLEEDDIQTVSMGKQKVYMWETDDSILYYSNISKIYLNLDSGNMFENTYFKTIDISGFDSSLINSTYYMFADCENLTTIYVSETWDISNVENTGQMFYDTYNILGEKLTEYDSDHYHGEYAHVDEGPSNPGYLTLKGHTKNFAILSGYDGNSNRFNERLRSMTTENKDFRKATTEEYNSVKNELTEDNIISTPNSPIKVYMWETNDSVLYYSSSPVIYMNKNSESMFYSTGLKLIDLSAFDTSNVTSMYDMFYQNINLEELDLSTFDISNVTEMGAMFAYCDNLATIYVSDTWDMSNVENTSDMFNNTYNLVGEKATIYNKNYIDGQYAHVDEGPSNPGYLTLKGHTKDFAILIGYYSENEINNKLTSMNTTNKEFRKATATEYNTVKDTLTTDDIITKTGQPKVYMWETNNNVLYYSSVSTIYLNSDSSNMFEDTGFHTIDMSGFDTTMIYRADYMFFRCENLQTIYVSESGDFTNIGSAEGIFHFSYNLVGEKGTMYDENHVSAEYAHVDGGTSNPGYFTLKGHTKDFTTMPTGDEFNTKITSMNTTNKEFRKATTEEYNSVKNTLTNADVISIVGSPKIYMWQTNDNVLYYSSVSTIYLNKDSSNMFKDTNLKTIDMSEFNIRFLDYADYMFANCEKLTTIYVSNAWDIYNINSASYMFENTSNIVGGQGTTYCESDCSSDNAYAWVDGGPESPGYLTLKGQVKNFAIMLSGEDFNSIITAINTTNKEFRKATPEEYNSVKNTLTNDNVVSIYPSPKKVYMWQTNDSILYYANTSTIYLNKDSSNMFKDTSLKTIDMSDFDTTYIREMDYIFSGNEHLMTIYVSEEWYVNEADTSYMFHDNINLTGEQGTQYNSEYEDGDYARIDEGQSCPGYLTLKGHTQDFAIMLAGNSFNNKIKSLNTTNKDFRRATLEEYNAIKNTLTNENIASASNSPKKVYMWATNDSILFYTSASTIFLINSDNMFKSTGLKTIDMSAFDNTYLESVKSMFENCENLTTIYVSDAWGLDYIDSENMFYNDTNLVGGAGTTYDENNVDRYYAHIDKSSWPGYLTDIADKE